MEVTMLLKLGNKRLASRVPINWSLNHTTVMILSCFFETGSHIVQADFNFALLPRMILRPGSLASTSQALALLVFTSMPARNSYQ